MIKGRETTYRNRPILARPTKAPLHGLEAYKPRPCIGHCLWAAYSLQAICRSARASGPPTKLCSVGVRLQAAAAAALQDTAARWPAVQRRPPTLEPNVSPR